MPNPSALLLLLVCAAPASSLATERTRVAPAGSDWTLDESAAKRPARKAKPAAAPVSAAEAERAARLAEGRRRFFEAAPAGGSEAVPEFGGYKAGGSGSVRPGAMFRF